MRRLFQILFIFNVFSTSAQNYTSLYLTTGLNRIGVAYEVGGSYSFQAHNVQFGFRFYEPDLVFEKDFPGINIGYFYALRRDKKMQLNLGAQLSGFYESKGSTKLWLIDPKLTCGTAWNLNYKWTLNLTSGVGTVVNFVETSYKIEQNTFVYLNYELSLGITYRLGSITNN